MHARQMPETQLENQLPCYPYHGGLETPHYFFSEIRSTNNTKGCGSRVACETMMFKLMKSAAKGWRKLNGSLFLPKAIRGVKIIDGEKSTESAA